MTAFIRMVVCESVDERRWLMLELKVMQQSN